jgi:3-oxoacyl-[acyl-carrier protein] reductase
VNIDLSSIVNGGLGMTKRAALVTGATSGMGHAIARRFAERGDLVGVWGITADLAEAAVDEIVQAGGSAVALHGDVSRLEDVLSAVSTFVETAGRLDVVVAAAGIHQFGTIPGLDPEVWAQTIGVNLTGVYHVAHATVPHLLESQGNFLAIGSSGGLSGAQESLAYCASKFGVTGLIRSLALDLGPRGVRVNQLCPGIVETPMAERGLAGLAADVIDGMKRNVPIGRFGNVSDIAAAAVYLTSEEAAYVTGASFSIDGGSQAGRFFAPPS